MTKSDQQLASLYFTVDLLVLVACFIVSNLLFSHSRIEKLEITVLSGLVLMWIVIGYWRKLYLIHLHNSFKFRMVNYLKSYFILLGCLSISYLFINIPDYERDVVTAFIVGFPIVNLGGNLIIIHLISNLRKKGLNIRKTAIVGVGSLASKIDCYFQQNKDFGYQILGFIYDEEEHLEVKSQHIIGSLQEINQLISEYDLDEVIIALPYNSSKKIKKVTQAADYHGIRVKYIPDYEGLFGGRFKMTRYGDLDVLNMRQISLDEIYASFFKRAFDILFSLGALIVLMPVVAWIAYRIKRESPGPLIYAPIRVGRSGKAIKVFKFRTMYQCDDIYNGYNSTTKNDPRITEFGKFLRKYSLDELPQFFNVLIGDMSVVGPRPHRSHLNERMQKEVPGYMIRHYLKPGITGWAQVNGWRGPTETEEQRQQRTRHDLWYLENWSLWLDFKIIFLTVFSKKVHEKAF
ncbi:undecaprenyl-phosphate glucose phosphotransferase [Pleomorphovibrio marinus]|uniref:undecaprenyl-phosphate glucose phosphotransferase n=1 Tax=Pleomorphovibrio marinus TaxID=2164132 RepID=UPI000E0BAA18|nr:undecaprenyl-phosphate glucose phosphotransferase [Pleomorphovibrio marinus]